MISDSSLQPHVPCLTSPASAAVHGTDGVAVVGGKCVGRQRAGPDIAAIAATAASTARATELGGRVADLPAQYFLTFNADRSGGTAYAGAVDNAVQWI